MKRIFWAIALIAVICCGCTERVRQKNLLTGGDPALATDTDMQMLRQQVDRIEKKLDKLTSNAQHTP